MTKHEQKQVGLLARPDGDAVPELGRFRDLVAWLSQAGLAVKKILFTEESMDEVRQGLLELDGVLVWVDPISDGRDRSELDSLLREVASRGVFISAHPDVILKIGTKDVLVSTRSIGWGSDCYRYDTIEEMARSLPAKLSEGPRVLKQHRGNGGNGVWRIEITKADTIPSRDSRVRVLHAQRESSVEEMTYEAFLERCTPYFTGSGCMIDQPYQPRLADGMIRCYMVQDRVAGFGHQFITALLAPAEVNYKVPAPKPRLYYGADKPEFQAIKTKLEDEWIPEMLRLLQLDQDSLPILWDADFLLGSKDNRGNDTYVLCEINVSSVSPFPDEALGPLAEAVSQRLLRH